MTIQINKHPGQKILELGGGGNRHPQVDCCVDIRKTDGVDFTANFEEPLPIQSDEWDGVISVFCMEHLSWRKTKDFLREVYRILKPGGKAIFITPNVEAQMEWIRDHQEGWDGKDAFEACSELIYGSGDYEHNLHKSYLSPSVATKLFSDVGFENILTSPYGARDTDLAIEAVKPMQAQEGVKNLSTLAKEAQTGITSLEGGSAVLSDPGTIEGHAKTESELKLPQMSREEMFDKNYFNGGGKVGGYANEGYRDFPVNEVTFRNLLRLEKDRYKRPDSVIEVGCGRGYLLKRFQDAGIRGCGLEISQHCWMTRACDGIIQHDICTFPWPWKDKEFDLLYSVATLEHIPEEFISGVIREMVRVSNRCIHGIDFGENDDGFDKTHALLRDKNWWQDLFHDNTPRHDNTPEGEYSFQILDKEELSRGEFPQEVLRGDGKIKVNLGSFLHQFHHGWINVDVHDLAGFSQANGYNYLRLDVTKGLPWKTGEVSAFFLSHVLEHFSYSDGLKLLRDMRRCCNREAVVRIIVPDADKLLDDFDIGRLSGYSEVNDGVEQAPTELTRLWALLHAGHSSIYDEETLCHYLREAGFVPHRAAFRKSISPMLLKETVDQHVALSLICEATPLFG